MRSLTLRLLALWGLSFCACFAVGILLVQLYRSSMDAQVARAEAVVAHACDLIEEQAGTSPDLTADVTLALLHEPGVEGGIWHHITGPVAYAFPTYEGTGPKTDLPAAERDQIAAINQRAQSTRQPVSQRVVLRAQTLLLHACPLRATPDQTAWTMTRVQAAPGFSSLRLGLGVLFALMILMSAWLGRMLLVWGRHLRGIEAALAGVGPAGMPAVPRTGERELDRIIDALNIAGLRLADARLESDRMAARMARTERLAGLGRVAAGIAHEIRNPIAAARLQGENALAGDDARRRLAITDMLTQIERLDTLVNELLAMTQRVDPMPVPVDLSAFLIAQAAHHTAAAAARAIEIITECPAATASLDPAMIGRVLDNLLSNAIRHTPAQGQVRLAATIAPGRLAITVADTGPGIAPDMTETLFEPFVTGRAEGTGLGLAIARELADAHGATLTHRRAENGQTGAVFTLELPQDQNWPPS